MSERGQTQIDFLIGMAVFLMAVGFVFSFVPTMIEPFDRTSGSDLMVADRSAAHLAESALGSDSDNDAPQRPSVLNETTVSAFFESPDLRTELGLSTHTQANVTIVQNGEIVTIDDTRTRAGPEPPSDGSIAVSTRIVLIGDQTYELYVRVW